MNAAKFAVYAATMITVKNHHEPVESTIRLENADFMKQLEMVSGNVLEKGMGYFVLFSKQYITNKQ